MNECCGYLFCLTATAAPGSPCTANEYQCLAGDQCVPVSYHCDGEVDCEDQSDERGCSELQRSLIILLAVIVLTHASHIIMSESVWSCLLMDERYG